MTEPDQAIIARLTSDVAVIGAYLARASTDLSHLEQIVSQRSMSSQPQARPEPPPWSPTVDRRPLAPPRAPQTPQSPGRSDGWIGKVLAVAGVAVTLFGVALLLVLAAQAGVLRPEVRVAAGAALAAGLIGLAWRLSGRPGGRVGSIALAATGIAAAYIDVIAATTIYGWMPPAAGLILAATIAVAGLLMARRWDTEQLGLLVLIPLIGLAPIVADGFTLLLVGFMLALSAASVIVQVGKDWVCLHAARVAVGTLPLLVALAIEQEPLLAVSSAVAAVLAIGSALLLLQYTKNVTAMALLSAAGTAPVLLASMVVDGFDAALLAGALAVALLGIVGAGGRLPMVTEPVRTVWSALAAVSALVAITVAFEGSVAGPVLLAFAVVVAVSRRGGQVARWCAVGFGVVGGLFYLGYAPLTNLIWATTPSTSIAVSTLVSSVLVVAFATTSAWSWPTDWSWAAAVVVALYGTTMFTVTAGVLVGGEAQGFFAGHVVATICWTTSAAAIFRYAARAPRARRSLPIGGGMAVVAAAMAKLFLFDLGTLDGIFRVVVFIVVGLGLLGMGAGYARLLAQQDESERK